VNVLVLGWYHHRNAGDDAIERAVTRWLDGHTLAFLPAGRRLPVSYARRWDAVLVGGGGVLQHAGGVFADLRRFVRRARVPVALVGVSAEDPEAALVDQLRAAAPHLCSTWLRDRGSLEALGLVEDERTFVGPDLAWLAPPAGEGAAPPTGVAVATAPHAGLDPAEWGPALAALPGPVRPWPFLLEGDADRRALRALLPGADVPAEHDPTVAGAAGVVVSARYHGLVFGLQQGTPVVGIGDSPKVRRLLQEQGLADWHVPADRPDRIGPVVASLLAERPAAARRAQEVAARLTAEAEEAGARSLALLEAAAQPLDGRSHLRRTFRL
jgi:polysaccharide pyruvyl transferase WcaK-like protein